MRKYLDPLFNILAKYTNTNRVKPVIVIDPTTGEPMQIGSGGGITSPLTTKGDLFTYSTDNTRLGVGADGSVLVADSNEATGLKWSSLTTTSFEEDLLSANWVLDSGSIYYQNVTHNLNTEKIGVEVYDSSTKDTVIPYLLRRINANTLRIYVEGNTDNLTVLIQSNTQNTLNPTLKNFVFVAGLSDLPTNVGGVITLLDNYTYYFTKNVDLLGNRLLAGANTTILGASSENAKITSTGLGVGIPLLTSYWTVPIRHIAIENVDTAIYINGNTNPPVALDWTGVNFVNVANIGEINSCDNFIFSKGSFLNSKNLVFKGTVGTIGIDNSLFAGDGEVGDIFKIDATCVITRRFRIIYSSVVVFGSTVGINVNTSATIPNDSYILDTINFSGGGTYTSGVTYLDNKAKWLNCKGIVNSSEFANYYMSDNATPTTIAVSGTAYKILGTTTPNSINQKFTHTDNRVTYQGALIYDFIVSATVTLVSGNNKQIGLYVAKNGVVVPDSEMYATTSGTGRAESIVVQTVLQLNQNDYIELFVENATDTTSVTVEFLNLICRKI